MSLEIELYSKLENPIEAIDRIGEMFARSGMFGCERVEQGKVLAMICLAEKKSPVAITRDYDIVEGKLRKKALAALADFRAAGGKHRWLSSGDTATGPKEEDRFAELELTDHHANKITYRYSMTDARAEGLVRDNSRWVKRPGNMLRARCISNGLGMLCPEIFAGDDSEADLGPMPAAPLNLSPEPKPANVVDVQSFKTSPPEDAKTEAAMGLAPQVQEPPKPQPERQVQPQAAAAPADFKPGPAYTAPPNAPKLAEALLVQLEQTLGEHGAKATAWMMKQDPPWLLPGQGLDSLAEGRAKRIIKQREGFIKAILS